MIEDDVLGDEWLLSNPVPAMRHVSHDPSLRRTVALRDGRRVTALEVQWGLFELAHKYQQSHGLDAVDAGVGADVMARWEAVLHGLETNPDSLATQIDWIAKRRLLHGYAERHGIEGFDARLKAIDLQYHDMRPGKGLAGHCGLERLVDVDAARRSMTHPPLTTRAYFRGRCLQKFPADVVAANWDSMVFDIGRDPLRRVPMMEPQRGTAEHVGALLDASNTAAELLERLGA